MKLKLLIMIVSFVNLFAYDYYTIIDDSKKIAKFYNVKQDYKNYLKNSIYIKLKINASDFDVRTKVLNILGSKKIDNFEIKKLSRPFEKYSLQLLRQNNLSKIINITFDNILDSWEISKILQESNEFAYVVPERLYKFATINSNDPLNDKTDYLDSLKTNDIWKIVKGDSLISIGIVDSGVMIDHEDLKNSLKINRNEIPDDKIDNDNNGFIDDYNGWDFVGDISANDLYNNNLKPDNNVVPNNKYNNHGTHVTGISCAITNNGKGIASLAYNLSFIPVKVSADDISQLNYVVKPFEGVLYVLNRGADVINCSWLSDDYDPLAQDIVNEVTEKGSVLVCAAGNSTIDNIDIPFISPASLDNVISVGAVSKDNSIANFSNYGWNVDIFAPGVSIYSTIMDNQYGNNSGTSMSSPLVASIVGLIKKLHPDWSFKQIELQLRANTKLINGVSNSDTTKYWGAVDPLKVVQNNNLEGIANPGITILDYFIDGTKLINETNKEYNVNLNLNNLLSTARNISVQFLPLSNYIEFDKYTYSINQLDQNEIEEINLSIKLNEYTPYFEGTIPILVVIKADNYRNLEIINLPYKIETSTKFLVAQYFDDYLDNNWINAKSPSKYSLWAIGSKFSNGKGIIYSYGKHFDVINTTKNPTAIFPFNNSKAIVALQPSNQNENTELALTENSGYSFKTLDKPFAIVNEIHFFDDNNGLVFGSNNGEYLGIKSSKNGGNSWLPAPLIKAEQNEIIINQAFKNNKVVFLTSTRNFYYSDSIGINWIKLGKIEIDGTPKTLLISENNSIVLISSNENKMSITYTLDLGKSWQKNQINFLSKIVNAFYLKNTEIIYCLLENGEIIYSNDNFKTWGNILNKDSKYGKLMVGTEFIDSCDIRLWQLNYNLYFSDIENVDANASRILEIAGANSIFFDTLEINKSSQSQIIFATNSGEGLVKIEDYSFSNNTKSSFVIEKAFTKFISPCQLYDSKIIFSPKTSGWHYDTLTISSNSQIGTIKYYLSGFAYDPSSIKISEDNNFKISPNPASDFITINLDRWSPPSRWTPSKIEIYDVMGILIQHDVIHPMTSSHRMNIKYLATGVYFLKIGNKVERFVKI